MFPTTGNSIQETKFLSKETIETLQKKLKLLIGIQIYKDLTAESWDTLADKIIKLVELNVPVCKASSDNGKKCPYANHQCLQATSYKTETYKIDQISAL